ncbi:hypothetical protein ECEC4402_3775, partial [Escherichia coli EC4402]
MKLSGYFIPPI